MASKDPFQATRRWRVLVGPVVVAALLLLVGTMGVVAPLARQTTQDDLRAAIVSDFYRIEHAAQTYARDNGEFPAASFNLSDGYDGGLRERSSAPLRHQTSWTGPYLDPLPTRPTRQSFWNLAEPQSLQDGDGDGGTDELWARLNRGYGEIDDATATWLDTTLDDGGPETGSVRVTATWIWFKIAER